MRNSGYYERNGVSYQLHPDSDFRFSDVSEETRQRVWREVRKWRAEQVAKGGRVEGGVWVYPAQEQEIDQ